ncbi:hypothetical protein [Streptomyces sp. MH60]|uniref:hypothetical protein n=1 Tax=Streptomyces sp. MH60 TaxID=1940758 RepID=UPI000D4FC67E|nr:hypothetical protein [Streptomyces sp. MH60]PPS89559.1 hypothetical protein BZZ08_01706 [Streptomyces sp. MH60]
MSRRGRKPGSRYLSVDVGTVPEGSTLWACDASMHAEKDMARVAIVPTNRWGEVDGPAHLIRVPVPSPASAQAELLGVIACHIMARSAGERSPVVLSDCRGTQGLLRDYQYGRTAQRTRALPFLAEVVESLGREIHRVKPPVFMYRRTTASLDFADGLASRIGQRVRRMGEYDDLPPSMLLDMATRLGMAREGRTPAMKKN